MSNAGANTSGNDTAKPLKVVEAAIEEARKAIGELLKTESNCPHFIRIAFYDAISYNPIAKVGGPNGSIRFWEGLAKEREMKEAMDKLGNLKKAGDQNVWSNISYADLYQLAGIEAVKKAGGPSIEFRHGRTDSSTPSKLPIEAIEEGTNATLLRDTFHRIGFTDKEIVALSSSYYYWMNYGRISSEQLNINNSYYKKLLKEKEVPKTEASNSSSATLRYWKCLLSDASFRKHVHHFAEVAGSFEKEYGSAHKKLSELGFKQFPQPILTEKEYHDIKHGIAFAVAMTILFGFVGFFYEAMRNHA